MKTLKFDDSLASRILSGTKTTTWRMFDEKDLKTGDTVQLVNSDSGMVFGIARITDIFKKQFGDITANDFTGHESYKTVDEMYDTYRGYYGDRINRDTEVKIIHLELVLDE